MEALSVQELLEAVHGRVLGTFDDLTRTVSRVDTDSRRLHPDSLFLPLVGERFDGHAYLDQALNAGCAGCFTQRERENYLPGKFYIKVDSTHRALRDLAVWYRNRMPARVVGVTGSVGKTTTRDMIAAVLSERFAVLKTENNYNNEIGVPLTLLRLERKHQLAVLEMGINHPGEMDYLSYIAKPDVVVITNIGDSHIENFGSRENTFAAKCEIFHHCAPEAFSVLNGDDPLLARLRGRTPGMAAFCGRADGLDYRASQVESDNHSRMSCRVTGPEGSCRMEIPALGAHMIYPVLTAAAVAGHFGMGLEETAAGVRKFAPTKMRMNILSRGGGVTILDDGYNANPQSMRAAIEVLDSYDGSRKIAVLGDMFELGAMAQPLHAGVGDCLARSHVDCLLAVGNLARSIYASAQTGVPECRWFATKEEALPALKELVCPGATVLVKASRGMAFETITEYLKSITEEI